MKEYTTNTPKFLKKINIVEENDLVNADNDTAAAKQLLQNDLVLDMRIKQCLGEDPDCGDSKDMVVTFESNDSESTRSWEDIPVMKSKETHALLFHKISIMVRNIRYLYKLLGTTDISKYGDGTVTDIISKLETEKIGNIKAGTVETSAAGTSAAVSVNKSGTEATINFKIPKGDTGPIGPIGPAGPSKISDSAAITIKGEYALDAREKNASIEGTLAHELSQLNCYINAIGTVTEASDTSEIASGDIVKLATVNITPGVWIVRCSAVFKSTNSTGTRICIVGWGNSEQTSQEVAGNPNGWTKIEAIDIFNEIQNSTASILVKQTSGSSITCGGSVRAVRIK